MRSVCRILEGVMASNAPALSDALAKGGDHAFAQRVEGCFVYATVWGETLNPKP